jgi:hypothetical protein
MTTSNGARQCSHPGCGVDAQMLRESTEGGLWCFSHDPSAEAQRQREDARRRGGEATGRRLRGSQPYDIGSLSDPAEITRARATVARKLAAREITPAEANAVNRTLTELRKDWEAVELAERVAELERRKGVAR